MIADDVFCDQDCRCSLFALLNFPLNSGIRNEPKKRGEHAEFGGDPCLHERERNGDEVGKRRNRAAASFTGPAHRRSQILVARAFG